MYYRCSAQVRAYRKHNRFLTRLKWSFRSIQARPHREHSGCFQFFSSSDDERYVTLLLLTTTNLLLLFNIYYSLLLLLLIIIIHSSLRKLIGDNYFYYYTIIIHNYINWYFFILFSLRSRLGVAGRWHVAILAPTSLLHLIRRNTSPTCS